MLFEKNKLTISRHIRNIFEDGELEEISSIAKNVTQLKGYVIDARKFEIPTIFR
ncbi:MAG: hypothetical protein RR543_04870 [Erysipelotrichales bacterium]